MIPLNFGLFWSGENLSYLRYLTFKTLRHFHPHDRIRLFLSKKYTKNVKWNREKQDFQNKANDSKDYLPELDKIGVETVKDFDMFYDLPPNYASDVFRYWFLRNHGGGIYLDCDQIILQSFTKLPLETNGFIYCGYEGYYPVGVLCGSDNHPIVRIMDKNIRKHINLNNYNSAGPYAMAQLMNVIKEKKLEKEMLLDSLNVPSICFYPVKYSDQIVAVYEGKFNIPKESMALHWWGGLPASQKFNNKYTEEFAKTSNDNISQWLRKNNLI